MNTLHLQTTLILIMILSFFSASNGVAQICGEVSTVVSNDPRIVSDIATDSSRDRIYISQSPFGSTILQLSSDGERSTFIDGLQGVGGLEVGDNGSLYVSEYNTQKIKLYDPTGKLLNEWESGLIGPTGLDLDSKGNLYIADYGELDIPDGTQASGNRIGVLKKDARDSVHILIEDDRLNSPVDIVIDESDNIYTANGRDGKILRYSKDGALTVLAEADRDVHFGWLAYLDGALYSTHFSGHTIYKTDIKKGTIKPFAGTGTAGSDDGNLNTASFHRPNGITPNRSKDGLYITETNYEADINRLRLIKLCD